MSIVPLSKHRHHWVTIYLASYEKVRLVDDGALTVIQAIMIISYQIIAAVGEANERTTCHHPLRESSNLLPLFHQGTDRL